MKNIIKLAIFALVTSLCASCHTELWEQDELTESKVWVASVSKNYKLYCYPEQEYFISEIGSLLERFPMAEWSIEESETSVAYTFSTAKDKEIILYNISYDKTSKSGILKINSKDGSTISENYLISVEMTMMLVDKNYK